MYSVMLVDDQSAILAGLKTLVEATGIAKVVATENDAVAVLATALAERPDLILLDVSLGQDSGIDVAEQILAQWPQARVLAVSAHANTVYVNGMINAGARGYMLKENGPREIADAIGAIMGGGRWMGAGLNVDC